MPQLNLLDIPEEPGTVAPPATPTPAKAKDKKPQAAAVAGSANEMSAANVAARAAAASTEADLSGVDPATIGRILVVSEGREVPLGIGEGVDVHDVARWALTNDGTAQRLASQVLGSSASHVAGAINVTVTREVRDNPDGTKDLLLKAVKVPGYKGGDGGW